MDAAPTGPPVLAPVPATIRGRAAALRQLLLWGPIACYAALQLGAALTASDSSDGLKTLVFFGAVGGCFLLQGGAARLEGRRIRATSPSSDLDLLRAVAIGVAIVSISVIATAFTGFLIAYPLD